MTSPHDPTLAEAAEAYCAACNQSYPAETITCPRDGARLVKLESGRDELIGKVLDERYQIRAPLGKGGMGTVYRGWQRSVDREVAIKVIHPKLASDRSAVKRFLREARLASRLGQPNIVNVYDFGQADGVLYLVMELLRGRTLAAELSAARRLSVSRTIAIALQLCDALEAAHAEGIVHRDLKPSNIIILDGPAGREPLKVLDFGLAKSLIQDAGSVVTHTDALLGTPMYMAPEQIEGAPSDQRADLYSLGCILYELLSGRPPFVDGAVSVVLSRHVNDTHADLSESVPARLRAVIDRLLAKRPEDRFPTASQLRAELEAVSGTEGSSSDTGPIDLEPSRRNRTEPEALAQTHAAASAAAAPPTLAPAPWRRRAAIGGVAIVALIATGWLVRSFVVQDAGRSPAAAGRLDARPPAPDARLADAPLADVPLADAPLADASRVDAGAALRPDAPPRSDTSTRKPPHPRVDAGVPALDFYHAPP